MGPAFKRSGERWLVRYEAKCHDGCEAGAVRANGDVTCETCGLLYREHPGCFQSRYEPEERGIGYYGVQVLCDGTHVHL